MITETEIYDVFAANRPMLLNFASRFLNARQDAEDCVSDAMLGAIGSRETFRGEASLLTWVQQIIRFRAYKFYRYCKHTESLEASSALLTRVEPSQEAQLLRKERESLVVRTMPRLSVAHRTAITSRLTGKPHGMSPNEFRNYRMRGIERLRELLRAA
jgi:RNA polymerase sigma factor (sigma-70 family)